MKTLIVGVMILLAGCASRKHHFIAHPEAPSINTVMEPQDVKPTTPPTPAPPEAVALPPAEPEIAAASPPEPSPPKDRPPKNQRVRVAPEPEDEPAPAPPSPPWWLDRHLQLAIAGFAGALLAFLVLRFLK
jgi:hypothetical protein